MWHKQNLHHTEEQTHMR